MVAWPDMYRAAAFSAFLCFAVVNSKCCNKKVVPGVSDKAGIYILVSDSDPAPASCLGGCVYTKEDDPLPGTNYCFKDGDLSTTCSGGGCEGGEGTVEGWIKKYFEKECSMLKFKNEACPASSGETGTCYTEAECSAAGGVASGNCASAFGVCCVFTVSACGGVVSQDNTYIQSPNYPAPAPTGKCMYTINKCDSNICQYRFEFEDVVVSDPRWGDCTNDTIMFSGFDAVSTKVVPMALCGSLTGQHMIVNVKDITDGSKIVFNIVSAASMAHWRIKVDQISCAETEMIAPPGCLTYDTTESGTIQSYNYQGGNGELINNQKFSHCIMYQDGFCDVALTAMNFDMGTNGDSGDSLTFNCGNVQTGNMFGSGGSLNWNFTGPYVASVCSDDMNSAMNIGYSISYLLLPC